MRILVLGGTSFVGRAIVDEALRAGAEVILFGRGKTGADLFPELTRLTRSARLSRSRSAGSSRLVPGRRIPESR
ncbi:MAG: NAD-dependent epimerase/dehydratase family protein [Streptosporangiaceae bacterium]